MAKLIGTIIIILVVVVVGSMYTGKVVDAAKAGSQRAMYLNSIQ